MKNWLLDEPSSSDNWLLSSETEEAADYNAFRSGAVDFVESAIGAGDELDAVVRRLSGEAATWDEAINQSRRELAAFEKENPYASKVLTGAGFVGGFFVPALGMTKIAQAGTAAARVGKAAGLGAAEGAAYGFLSGEGEEGRLGGAALGAGLGGVIGGAAGKFLTKGADEVAKTSDNTGIGSYMGGEEGFVRVGRAKEESRLGRTTDTSTSERVVTDVRDDAPVLAADGGQTGIVGNILLSTREWFVKNVGERAAKLAEDSELMIRHDQRAIDELFDTDFKNVADMFEENKALKSLALRMNKSIDEDRRISWEALKKAARNQEELDNINYLESQIKTLQEFDFVKTGDIDYFPTKAIEENLTGVARPDAYANPVLAVKELAEDISSARALAARFDIDINSLPQPKDKQSRLNVVIDAIEKQAKKQGATPAVAANLGNGLRSQLIASKKGGNTVGAVARRATSAALLANPLNAVLNIAEGITAPIYQNGVKAWAQTLPKAIVATFSENAGIKSKNWVSNRELGLDKDFMGELANTGKKAMDDAAEAIRFTRLPEWFVGGVDLTGKALYKLSGVSTVNRMGQEILSNSAVNRGINLANKGDQASLQKLRKHDGMRGLTEKEFMKTVDALKRKDLSSPWVMNFAGASMNKWQPVSASALPKAFHDNPNGRVAYSMLSYMNKQMNSIRTDVGLNLMKVQQQGINTKEGAKALKDAMKNSAKYAALFGVFAGAWDDWRKTLDLSNDKEMEDLFTPDGLSKAALNQISSNLTSGIYNMRAEEYGGQSVFPIPPALNAAFDLSTGAASVVEGLFDEDKDLQEAVTPLLRASRTYVPVVSNIDRMKRITTGERLFEDFLD
jgi:hypothetical protein